MQVATADSYFGDSEFDIRNLFDRAADDIRGGRLAHAEAAYARIVAEQPDFPDAWFLFGLTALDTGNVAAAVDRLQRAVAMRKAEPRYRMAHGRALLTAERPANAVTEFEAALRLAPDSPDVPAALARACMAAGAHERAAGYSKQALAATARHALQRVQRNFSSLAIPLRAAFRPGIPYAASRLFEAALIAERYRDTAGAAQRFRDAAALAPHWPQPLIEQARIAFDAEQFGEARNCLESALERAPEAPSVLAPYGRILSRMAYHAEAVDLLARAHAQTPDHLGLRCQLAFARYRASATDAALADFDAILETSPKHLDAHMGTARCHIDLGDRESAIHWLERTLALKPDHADAWRELANLKALTADDLRLSTLERLADATDTSNRRRKVFNLALGETYRTFGDAARSFRHYEIGNALKDVVFDLPTYRSYLDRVMHAYDASHFARVEGTGDDSEVPVFIVGMPRSGTSLIEQILASHPAVFGAGEREEIARLAETLGDGLGAAGGDPAWAGSHGDSAKAARPGAPRSQPLLQDIGIM
ncbi:MAG: tetratricopeptide repeat protein, partial [Alphaproteobacteria bacterium]